ncbi:hypothetical protein EIL50_02515 [bacterium NHP-B]|nr:hypothetical protein EIL50_02515 [bacterium NHP-B]
MHCFLRLFWVFLVCAPVCVSVLKASPVVSIKPLSCRFSPNHMQALVTLEMIIEKDWSVQAQGASFSAAPTLVLQSMPSVRTYKVFWPDPVWVFKEGFHTPTYQQRLVLPVKIDFAHPTPTAHLQAQFLLFACHHHECRALDVSVSYKIEAPHHIQPFSFPEPPKARPSFLWVLFISFLGGCLLNFMPCVLPVLGVKLLVFTKNRCPKGFLLVGDLWASVAGIFAAFMLLALVAISLKLLGHTVGWGLHFQNPYFLSCMAAMLLVFIAQLWNMFEVNVAVLFQKYTLPSMHTARAFLTGVFSVLIATPCTAPFVGTAVGFALSQQVGEILAVFSLLALGFSSPYWVAALLPSHHIRLPKPGRWLWTFQVGLSLFLLGTWGWFIALLSWPFQGMYVWLLCALSLLVLVGFFLRARGVRLASAFLVMHLILLCLAPLAKPYFARAPSVVASSSGLRWQTFRPEDIATFVSQGRVVLVDITAAWCLTCRVNKSMVLNRKEMTRFLTDASVVCMRGDWTHTNETIAFFLKTFQRAGIPFNAVFGPGAPEGIVLPEILKQDVVKEAVKRAQGPR